ncbi:MAG TPA: hypothetical protein VG097_11235, partial [Gemmata sp.]|nr:hypothetical protein [Gemmata sp.]
LVLPCAVPVLAIFILCTIYDWPKKTRYTLQVVADVLTLQIPGGSEVKVSCSGMESLVLGTKKIDLTVKGVRVDGEKTTVGQLRSKNELDTLTIETLGGSGVPRPSIFLTPVSPKNVIVKLKLAKTTDETIDLKLAWDRQKGLGQSLSFVPQTVTSGKVIGGEKFLLEVRNCRVGFGQNYKVDVNNDSLQAIEVVLEGPVEGDEEESYGLNFEIKETIEKDDVVDFMFPAGAGPHLATIEFPSKDPKYPSYSRDLKNPRFEKAWSGRLDIPSDNRVDLEKDYVLPPSIDITGAVNKSELQLFADGFHMKARGEAKEIKVDDENKISDPISKILKSAWAMAMLALIAWFVDKMISLYGPAK